MDIGGGTTDVIVYHEDGVLHAGTIPLGGSNITYDIAYGIQTTLEQAEKLKCQYGSAKSALADPEENINITVTNGRDSKTISRNYYNYFFCQENLQPKQVMNFPNIRMLN